MTRKVSKGWAFLGLVALALAAFITIAGSPS